MDGLDDFPPRAISRESRSFLDVAAVAEVVAELTVDERTVSAFAEDGDNGGGLHVFVPDLDDVAARGQARQTTVHLGRSHFHMAAHGPSALHERAAFVSFSMLAPFPLSCAPARAR